MSRATWTTLDHPVECGECKIQIPAGYDIRPWDGKNLCRMCGSLKSKGLSWGDEGQKKLAWIGSLLDGFWVRIEENEPAIRDGCDEYEREANKPRGTPCG